MKKLIVVGASGLVGSAALKHFAAFPDWQIVGVSRRLPTNLSADAMERITHLPLDLTDQPACADALRDHDDVTHVIYTAVHEQVGDVVEGWQTSAQMDTNLAMLRNFFEPLEKSARSLQHVSLLQGGKAYGVHTFWPDAPMSTPARESEPRHPHANFYWLQQDYLTEKQLGKPWSWTIFRPQIIFGDPVGSNLSVLSVIGAYGALERAAGRDLAYPGGPGYPLELIDVDLIADALGWAAISEKARNEIFNIANGDVVVWKNVWPVIADALGMKVAPPRPQSMMETLRGRGDEWKALVERNNLSAPASLDAFIGGSPALTDWTFAYGAKKSPPPILLSTVKLRQAGFPGCIDSEVMLRKWIDRLVALNLIPAADIGT